MRQAKAATVSALLLRREHIGEVLFSILLACLGRLADLLADRLPFVVLVLLDRTKQGGALILGKFSIVHIFVPVLLDTALGAGGESLANMSAGTSWSFR